MNGIIENQERQAQRSMVGSQRLPRMVQFGLRYGLTWDAICATWGMTVGGEFDDLFNYVTLPAGWQIVASDHSMWTQLADEQGRARALIFYKGAFYDRRAHIVIQPRHYWNEDFESDAPNVLAQVWDRGVFPPAIIFEAGKAERKDRMDYSPEFQAQSNAMEKAAREYLATNFPDHYNPLAYW